MAADPVVSPADTPEAAIRRFIALPRPAYSFEWDEWNEARKDASRAVAALLAVGERDKAECEGLRAEVERLRDRAVCSGCGSDVGESGVCTYPGCEEGEMIPASDLPFALRVMSENFAADREEWADELTLAEAAGERDRQRIARLTEQVERLLDCRGATNGTVSKRGGDPAVCRKCAESARAVLADEEDAANG